MSRRSEVGSLARVILGRLHLESLQRSVSDRESQAGLGPRAEREAQAERMAEGGPAERGEVCARPPETGTCQPEEPPASLAPSLALSWSRARLSVHPWTGAVVSASAAVSGGGTQP